MSLLKERPKRHLWVIRRLLAVTWPITKMSRFIKVWRNFKWCSIVLMGFTKKTVIWPWYWFGVIQVRQMRCPALKLTMKNILKARMNSIVKGDMKRTYRGTTWYGWGSFRSRRMRFVLWSIVKRTACSSFSSGCDATAWKQRTEWTLVCDRLSNWQMWVGAVPLHLSRAGFPSGRIHSIPPRKQSVSARDRIPFESVWSKPLALQ